MQLPPASKHPPIAQRAPPVATVKLGNAYQFEKFGTGNSLLRYGIHTRCSKRLPTVRDAFSEAFGVKNRLFRYRRDIRCAKQPPVVREAFSETFDNKKGSWGTRRIFGGAQNSTYYVKCIFKGPQNSRLHRLWTASCRTGRSFSARNAHRSEVSKYKKGMTSKS